MQAGVHGKQTFEDLRIWQNARLFVVHVYSDFKSGTPGTRDLAFRTQLQRAAISVMSNIAEGFERASVNEFAHFLDIAKGSCGEVRSLYYSAEDLKYASPVVARLRREAADRLARGIEAFRRRLRS
jgi:four helix bundle protein